MSGVQQTSRICNTIAVESGLKANHNQKILDTLAIIGSGTSYEIAAHAKLDHVAVSRRLSEMKEVYDTGIKGRTPSNRPCIKWAAYFKTVQTSLFN